MMSRQQRANILLSHTHIQKNFSFQFLPLLALSPQATLSCEAVSASTSCCSMHACIYECLTAVIYYSGSTFLYFKSHKCGLFFFLKIQTQWTITTQCIFTLQFDMFAHSLQKSLSWHLEQWATEPPHKHLRSNYWWIYKKEIFWQNTKRCNRVVWLLPCTHREESWNNKIQWCGRWSGGVIVLLLNPELAIETLRCPLLTAQNYMNYSLSQDHDVFIKYETYSIITINVVLRPPN